MKIEDGILYEDQEVLVCRKPSGLAVQNASFGKKDLESILKTYLAEKSGRPDPYLAVVHRLDQPVQGILVFAKSKRAAGELSRQAQDGRMEKEYLAVLEGSLPEKEGILEHFLIKEKQGNVSRAVKEKAPGVPQTAGAKRARLSYRILGEKEGCSLARILLETGRHHQIRVQCSAAGAPLWGDSKYNPSAKSGETLALCASRLAFVHPASKKKMKFSCVPEGAAFEQFEAFWQEKKR